MKTRTFPIHHLLFAVYPILFLYAHNVEEATANQILVPVLLSVAASTVLWVALSAFLGDGVKASLVTTLLLVGFFSYGHAWEFLESRGVFVPAYRHLQLIPFMILAMGYATYFLRVAKRDFLTVTKWLNALAIVLVAMVVMQVGRFEPGRGSGSAGVESEGAEHEGTSSGAVDLSAGAERGLPDIYYILLDEFASFETAKRVYGYDNEPLRRFFEENGFFVASGSRTRYSSTWPGLASFLNMEYYTGDTAPKVLYPTIMDNKVARFLKSLGYKYVYVSDQMLNRGAYGNSYADIDLEKLKGGAGAEVTDLAPLALMILRTTMLRPYYDRMVKRGLVQRNKELLKLRFLKEVVRIEGPKFVFSHHLVSHAPFVFDDQGGTVAAEHHKNWKDKKYYLNSYIFATAEIIGAVESILEGSGGAAVIVVQSDHGPRGGVADNNPLELNLGEEWKKILNAYYFPDGKADALYDTISPVNTFRVILNQYCGGSYALVSDS